MSRIPRLWPWLAASFAASVVANFTDLHGMQRSDSLIPVLSSLYGWTPFFWGQDRFGMLVALLALPIRHPLANLLFQTVLTTFCAVGSMLLAARYLVRDDRWPIAGGAAAALFLALSTAGLRFQYLATMGPYGVSLFLALLSVLLLSVPASRLRIAAAVATALLACWVHAAISMIVVPLLLLRWRIIERTPFARSEIRLQLIVLAAATAAVFVLMRFVPVPDRTDVGLAGPSGWLYSVWRIFINCAWQARVEPGLAAILLLSLPGAVIALRRIDTVESNHAWRAAAVSFGAAASLWLGLSCFRWMHVNGWHYRYMLPALVFVQAGLLAVGARAIPTGLSESVKRRLFAAVAALLVASPMVHGFPSPARVRSDLDATIGARTADIVDARCTHIAGDFFLVWPATFHANLVLYERGEPPLWGVTWRSDATRDRWLAVPRESMRVAILGRPHQAIRELPRLVPVEERPTVTVWRPAP